MKLSFFEEEFEKVKLEELVFIEENCFELQVIVLIELCCCILNYSKFDFCYMMNFDEEVVVLNKVMLDEVKVFYKDFYGVFDVMVVVVGDFDEVVIEEVFSNNFVSWESFKCFECLKDFYFEFEKQNVEFEILDKVNVWFLVV